MEKLARTLEQRVRDQVAQLERLGRLRRHEGHEADAEAAGGRSRQGGIHPAVPSRPRRKANADRRVWYFDVITITRRHPRCWTIARNRFASCAVLST